MFAGGREERGLPERGDGFSNIMEAGNCTMCADNYLHWIIIPELRSGFDGARDIGKSSPCAPLLLQGPLILDLVL